MSAKVISFYYFEWKKVFSDLRQLALSMPQDSESARKLYAVLNEMENNKGNFKP